MDNSAKTKAFILFVLNEILSYFNLNIEGSNKDKINMVYHHNDKTSVKFVTTFDKLLEFCGIRELAFRYKWINETVLFDKITQCSYFNYLMFRSKGYTISLYTKAKGSGIGDIYRSFISHLVNNSETEDCSFYITKHKRMYVKAIDYFFDTKIEQTLAKRFFTLKDNLLSHDKIKGYIKDMKGMNKASIEDKVIEDTYNELKEMLRHKEGGLEKYLQESSMSTVKHDIQNTFRYYVNKLSKNINNGDSVPF